MPADAVYFDTTYLVRIYLEDRGYAEVRKLAGTFPVFSAWHGRAEVIAAFHRAHRERRIPEEQFEAVLRQFRRDCLQQGFHWLPLQDVLLNRLEAVYQLNPPGLYLRAADALHLACAAEHGFRDVYSNDRHFLAAAPHFGLRGINLIPPGA